MSKNLTRKGLAFGALVALGSSVLAGAPAYAADTVVLAPNYSSDTTLATAVTETFTLNASLAPGSTSANIAQLKYKIVNNGAAQVNYSIANAGTAVTGNVTAVEGNEYATPTSATAVVANTIALSINAASATTTTQTATVTAFIDANLNGLVETGEAQASQTVSFIKYSEITSSTTFAAATEGDKAVTATLKFTNINNQSLTDAEVGIYFTKGNGTALGSTFAITAATNSTTTATATAANDLLANDTVNTADLAPATYVQTPATVTAATATDFAYTITAAANTDGVGTATRADSAAGRGNVALVGGAVTYRGQTAVSYSATNGGWKFVTGAVDALAKGSAIKAQPLLKNGGLGAAQNTDTASTIGTAATSEVVARVLGSFVGNTVKSTTASAAASAAASVTQNVSLNGEKQVYFLAKDTATTPAAKAGQAVAVAVTTSATLSSTITLTVNGTTYTSNAALPGATGVAKLALTTGSDGKVTVTYKTAGFSNANTVAFAATAENFSATVTGTETTRTYATYIANNEGNTAATTDGVAVKVELVTQDQFGAAPADGTFQISAVEVSNSQATAASSGAGSDTYGAVTGGKTTLNLVDNGTGVGNAVFGLTRYSVNASGVVSAPTNFAGTSITASVWGTANGSLQFTVAVKSAADIAAGEVAVTGATTKSATTGIWTINSGNAGHSTTTPAALTYSDFAAVDLRAIVGSAPANTALDGATPVSALALTGTVSSANTSTYASVVIPSATVTVSAAGLQFSASQDSADVYGTDSLTFFSAADGTFSVNVWSHKAGKNTITIKSGTGTATVDVYFAAASELSATTVTTKVADGAAQFQSGRALDVTVTVADKFGNPVALDATWSANTDAKLTISQTGAGYLSASGDVAVVAGAWTSKLITNSGDLGTSTITATLNWYDATLTDKVVTSSSEFGITDVTDISSAGKAIYVNTEFAKGKVVTVYIDGKRMPVKAAEATDNAVERKYTQKTAGKHTVTVRVSGGVVASETVVTTK